MPPSELECRALCQRGEIDAATHLTIRLYGPGIMGWLISIAANQTIAEDVFQNFCFALWRGLSSFRWESSLLTWCYRLAWSSFYHFRRGERRFSHVPLSEVQSAWAIEASSIRSRIQRQQTQERLVALRQQLPEDLQSVLILRLDRDFSFAEVAEVLSLTEENARQKFHRAKAKLKEMAKQEGLLS